MSISEKFLQLCNQIQGLNEERNPSIYEIRFMALPKEQKKLMSQIYEFFGREVFALDQLKFLLNDEDPKFSESIDHLLELEYLRYTRKVECFSLSPNFIKPIQKFDKEKVHL